MTLRETRYPPILRGSILNPRSGGRRVFEFACIGVPKVLVTQILDREYPCCMSEEQRLLRVGVLGAGPISQAAHFEACRKAKNAELYAICDVAEDLLERMSAIHTPRKAYADYDAMLADPKVEAVIVAIADQSTPRCLQDGEGKPYWGESMGVTVEEARSARRARPSGSVQVCPRELRRGIASRMLYGRIWVR